MPAFYRRVGLVLEPIGPIAFVGMSVVVIGVRVALVPERDQ